MTNRIAVDARICSGKPFIRGTRIMVRNILGMLAGGYTRQQIIDTYPEITVEDVDAALEYACHVVDKQRLKPST
jgi:uncharacterized protein (DUF433 family)